MSKLDCSLRRRLFEVIDARMTCAYNGAPIDHLGIREGRVLDPFESAISCARIATRFDSYPPGPSLYALWQRDEERGAA